MGQYLLIPFLVGWTSIYQLFWGSLGARVLTHSHIVPSFWSILNNISNTSPRHDSSRHQGSVNLDRSSPWTAKNWVTVEDLGSEIGEISEFGPQTLSGTSSLSSHGRVYILGMININMVQNQPFHGQGWPRAIFIFLSAMFWQAHLDTTSHRRAIIIFLAKNWGLFILQTTSHSPKVDPNHQSQALSSHEFPSFPAHQHEPQVRPHAVVLGTAAWNHHPNKELTCFTA